MTISNENLQPSPSDFGDYVYCGNKWAFEKEDWSFNYKQDMRKDYTYSSESKQSNKDLIEGQNNEEACIKWVLLKYDLSEQDIIFWGIKDSRDLLTSDIKVFDKYMLCKPDLIVCKNNRNLLFEFKAAKKIIYPLMEAFDSVHAQIWCYTKLNTIKVDDYHLLRYYINPLNNLSSDTPVSFDSSKYEDLLKHYLLALALLERERSTKSIISQDEHHKDFNQPRSQINIKIRCTRCDYRIICHGSSNLRNGW